MEVVIVGEIAVSELPLALRLGYVVLDGLGSDVAYRPEELARALEMALLVNRPHPQEAAKELASPRRAERR